MEIVLLVVHVLVGIAVIGVILLQHGKGADMGAAFGSGSAGSLFGASGSANFMSRTTAVMATIFFLTSLGLTYLGSNRTETKGVIERARESQQKPAADGVPAPTVPAPAIPVPSAPAPAGPADSGTKAGEVPK